jgi:hypothetical protein
MRRIIGRFGVGVVAVLVAGAMAVTGMSVISNSADASAPTSPGTTVTIADQSCTSGAHGVVAVNALNCNDVQIGNDLVDVVGVGSNTTSDNKRGNGQEHSSNHNGSSNQNGSSDQNGSSVKYKDQSCNSGAHGVVAVNALNCNNIEIGNDLVDVVGIGGNFN